MLAFAPFSSPVGAGTRPGATGFTLLRVWRVTEAVKICGAAAAVVRGRTDDDDCGETTRLVTDDLGAFVFAGVTWLVLTVRARSRGAGTAAAGAHAELICFFFFVCVCVFVQVKKAHEVRGQQHKNTGRS